jgi:hypothetical protein
MSQLTKTEFIIDSVLTTEYLEWVALKSQRNIDEKILEEIIAEAISDSNDGG